MNEKVYPCLWCNNNAKERALFYCSVFKNSHITSENNYVVEIVIFDNKLILLNGGDKFPHTEAASLVVLCDSQEEIDTYWSLLTKDGGSESMCGWLKDKYGFSWQIVPSVLGTLMTQGDDEAKARVAQTLFSMKKLDISLLERAHKGLL